MNRYALTSRRQQGLSYVEVLLAAVIIAISIVPVSDALRGAIGASELDTAATENHYRLVGKLEDVLAQPFADVLAAAAGTAVASSYSDAGGSVDRRLVFINAYDGDNADADNDPFTGSDADLLWVRVEIEGSVSALQALMVN